MKIPDFLRFNDWKNRNFVIITFSFLISFNGLYIINHFLFKIPIFTQLIGFFILTFIPGFIILKIFRIHNINRITNFLLAVGLSIFYLIIIGLLASFILPYLGIQNPISALPLFVVFNLSLTFLLFLSYIRDKDFQLPNENLEINFSPGFLSIILIPFLSIFGTYLMNYYNSNLLLLFFLFIISLIPVIIVFRKIPKNLYPLLIFVISISILFHTSLISDYIWGYDIHDQYFISNNIIESGLWNVNYEYPHNSLLIISIFSPVYSILCNLGLIWLFRLIFPLLFSLMPLALYIIYERFFRLNFEIRENCSSLLALLSSFVLIAYPYFFLRAVDKQSLGQLFLILIILLSINKNITPFNKNILAIILSFSLVVSHYGISFLFMFCLFFAFIFKNLLFIKQKKHNFIFDINYIIFFSSLTLVWFIFTSGGFHFHEIIKLVGLIFSNIIEVFQPATKSGLMFAEKEMPTLVWDLYKFIQISLQILITIGIFRTLLSISKRIKKKIPTPEITLLSIAFFGLVVLQTTVTYGAGMERILLLTLMLLSPFALIGCMCIFNFLKKIAGIIKFKMEFNDSSSQFSKSLKFFSIFLIFYILLNSGAMFEICGDPYSSSFALNNNTDYAVYTNSEVIGTHWAKENIDKNSNMTTQWNVENRLLGEYFSQYTFVFFSANTSKISSNTYIFLGKITTEKGEIYGQIIAPNYFEHIKLKNTIFYYAVLNNANSIYNNNQWSIYLTN